MSLCSVAKGINIVFVNFQGFITLLDSVFGILKLKNQNKKKTVTTQVTKCKPLRPLSLSLPRIRSLLSYHFNVTVAATSLQRPCFLALITKQFTKIIIVIVIVIITSSKLSLQRHCFSKVPSCWVGLVGFHQCRVSIHQ